MSVVIDTRRAKLKTELYFTSLPISFVALGEKVHIRSDRLDLWRDDPLVSLPFIDDDEQISDGVVVIALQPEIADTHYHLQMSGIRAYDPWLSYSVLDIKHTLARDAHANVLEYRGDQLRPFSVGSGIKVAVHYGGNVRKSLFTDVVNVLKAEKLATVQTGVSAMMCSNVGCEYDGRDCFNLRDWCNFLRTCICLVTDSETAATAALCSGTAIIAVLDMPELGTELIEVSTTPALIAESVRKVLEINA